MAAGMCVCVWAIWNVEACKQMLDHTSVCNAIPHSTKLQLVPLGWADDCLAFSVQLLFFHLIHYFFVSHSSAEYFECLLFWTPLLEPFKWQHNSSSHSIESRTPCVNLIFSYRLHSFCMYGFFLFSGMIFLLSICSHRFSHRFFTPFIPIPLFPVQMLCSSKIVEIKLKKKTSFSTVIPNVF